MKNYYAEELAALRTDAVHFARKYPALAPMLAGVGGDPDVERVLEGAAFLCGRIRERLSQNAPRLLQNLLRWTFPQALLPLPSTAMIRFRPLPGTSAAFFVPRATRLAARPVDGTSCTYSTMNDLFVPAAQIAAVETQAPTGTPYFTVALNFAGNPLAGMPAGTPLVLYLTGTFGEAAQRLHVLLDQLDHLEVAAGGATYRLPASALQHHALPLVDMRIPGERRRNHAYMEVIRYLYMPAHLLFLKIEGLEKLSGVAGLAPGERLDIRCCLKPPFERIPVFNRNSFALGVVPACNIFPAFAEPITVDHTQTEYRLRPQDEAAQKLEIIGVTRVTGLFPGGRTEVCQPYEYLRLSESAHVYSVRFLQEGEPGEAPEYRLAPLYARQTGGLDALEKHVLSVQLTCCNREVPNALGLGDICQATDDSPAQATFENITTPTPMQPRPEGDLAHWLYLSHTGANLLPQASAGLLRAMLDLYIGGNSVPPERAAANRRYCAAILEFSSQGEERLIRGRLYRGRRLFLKLDPSGFASVGACWLFANALERFFSGFTAINDYARLTLEVAGTGERMEWPPRMGDRQLR